MKHTNIYNYIDYRKFLGETQVQIKTKRPEFTIRFIAGKAGYKSPGHITWIFQGKRNLPAKQIETFANIFKLGKKETEYFNAMVEFSHAKTTFIKKVCFERLVSLQKSKKRIVGKDELKYWSKWYHSAIRELVAIRKISDNYREVARLLIPHITSQEAKKAIALLEKIGFIKKGENSFYYRVDDVIMSEENWKTMIIRQYQMDLMDLAKSSLDTIPKKDRDISVITLSISEKRFALIRERIKAFQQEIVTLAKTDDNPDRIYQLGLQLFPMSESSAKS